MLQNISQNSEENQNENNIKEVVLKVFSIQNILVYIITLCISMVGFESYGESVIAPFGLAMVAAAISAGIPAVMVYISSLIGIAIKFGGQATGIYLASSILLIIMVAIKKPIKDEEANEKIKLGIYLFLSVLIVSIVKMIFTGFYTYDIMISTVLSIATYIFYKIFVNSIGVISQYRIKKVFSIEEIIGASLLISIAVSAFGSFSIYSFSIRNIICIFIVLLLGWRNGVLIGGISGTTIGIVLGIIGEGNPALIAAYAISGMLAGLLNRFGRIGVIVGFVLGNVIIAYSANGGVSNIIMFQEILIASIGLLVMPKQTKINIEDVIPTIKLLPEAGGQIEGNDDALLKLDSINNTITEMAKGYKTDDSYEKNEEMFEDELIRALEGLEENILYDDVTTPNMLKDLFDNLVENDIITENEIISICAKNNIYLMNLDDSESKDVQEQQIREMERAINSAYHVCKVNLIWKKKIAETNNNMSEQLNTVKTALNGISSDFNIANNDMFQNEENLIKTELELKSIELSDIKIKKKENGRFFINASTNICDDMDGKNCPIKAISRTVSKVLNEKLTVQDQKCGIRLNSNVCMYTYLSEDKYIIQFGIAKAQKDGSIVSGDTMTQVRLGDGQYLFAISDGKGTGAEARKNSKIAVSMLERLLSSGFDKDTSIRLINSALLEANKDDNYATLDINIMDLYGAKMQLIKSGACPTFVKSNKSVTIIKSESLPTGIMKDISVDTYDKDISNGDIIIMCSDGILDSSVEYSNKNLWLKYLLEDIQTDSPERIANIILKEAIDNNMGKSKDDMSVIAIKVLKK